MSETLTPSAFAMQSCCRALFQDMRRLFPSEHLDEDFDYLVSRMENEGNQFMFTTLPLLGKAVERALIRCDKFICPIGWKLQKGTRLPLFLNLLFRELFCEDGSVHAFTEKSHMALLILRQLTLLWSKVEGRVEEEVAQAAVQSFRERTTRDVVITAKHVSLAREILERLFASDHPCVLELRRFRKEPWGRHGPGAVADKSSPSEKWDFSHWAGLNPRLFEFSVADRVYPRLNSQPCARVTAVPKDFRGPRIICIEPKENQFAQQGLMDIFYRLLTSHSLTKRSISFRDDTHSRRLCYRQDVCTIDLKDASDNLSLRLARLLLPGWIFSLVTRYRTRFVDYNNTKWAPNCLATMGNACCFPLETLLFWAIARSVVHSVETRMKIRHRGPVRVFGDDIIVPSYAAKELLLELGRCGLVVNHDKTCIAPLVKESCGEWVFMGKSQIVVKVKTTHVSDQRTWLQYMSYSAQVYKLGFYSLAQTMLDFCLKFLPISCVKTRYNKNLQTKESRFPMFASKGKRAELSGYTGLYAWHVQNDTAPFLHGTSKEVKRRWTTLNSYDVLLQECNSLTTE